MEFGRFRLNSSNGHTSQDPQKGGLKLKVSCKSQELVRFHFGHFRWGGNLLRWNGNYTEFLPLSRRHRAPKKAQSFGITTTGASFAVANAGYHGSGKLMKMATFER